MRRYSTLIHVIALAALLALACVSPSTAVVPRPDGFVTVPLSQGWFANQLVWFTCTTTNDIRTAQTQNLTLAPKLSSANLTAAPTIYIVKNFQQGPIFTAIPPGGLYTGLWRVKYITWDPGFTPRPIINATLGDPRGIPVVGVTVTNLTDIVLDYPILIVGQLSIAGPTYKIPQLVSFNSFSKTAVLPFFNAFNQNFIHKNVTIVKTLITDSSNASIAPLIGANFAPLLATMDPLNSQNAWLLDPTMMQPPGQLPVLESCASSLSWQNQNFAYSPIVKGHILIRLTATPSSIFNNPTTIEALIASGALAQTGTTTLNVQEINPILQ